jgi:hypothetical protein
MKGEVTGAGFRGGGDGMGTKVDGGFRGGGDGMGTKVDGGTSGTGLETELKQR